MAGETGHELDEAEQVLTLLRKRTSELDREVEEALRRVRARGTGDVTEDARNAVQDPEPLSTRQLVENYLRENSAGVQDIARALGETVEKVTDIVQALRAENGVYNIGNEEMPLWTLRIGDDTPTSELKTLVHRLISERPMTTRELTAATGARMPRVNGVLVEIQRAEPGIINVGKGHVYRWFILPEDARPAMLRRKTPTKRG